MVIDSSAIISILLGESDAESLAKAIISDPRRLMSSFSMLEASIVIESKKGESGGRELDLLLHKSRIEIVALNNEQVEIARHAWRNFGKGRHDVSLNIGDCCSYALAKHSGESILFKGDDFSKTDLNSVPVENAK